MKEFPLVYIYRQLNRYLKYISLVYNYCKFNRYLKIQRRLRQIFFSLFLLPLHCKIDRHAKNGFVFKYIYDWQMLKIQRRLMNRCFSLFCLRFLTYTTMFFKIKIKSRFFIFFFILSLLFNIFNS